MISFIQNFNTVILADGTFPEHEIPLSMLRSASLIVSCDGATSSLLDNGFEPDFIVGDLDSLDDLLKEKYADILYCNPDQETNDLTKAVEFCLNKGFTEITILGATGKREDHTLANISLLAEYAREGAKVQMISDHGVFSPILRGAKFESFPKQQVSIFSLEPQTEFTSDGLVYKLENRPLKSWWEGTLNEACSDSFEIAMNRTAKAIIFRSFR